jgi:FKBP-type peptidyl-prolyl cis-trans isomerase
MKLILTLVILASLFACTKETSNAEDPKDNSRISSGDINELTSLTKPTDEQDKYSYLLGYGYVKDAINDTLFKFNPKYFLQGAIQAFDENEDYFTESELKRIGMEFQQFMEKVTQRIQQKEIDAFNARGEKFKNMHEQYVADYLKKNPNAKKMPSGVIFEKIQDGIGPRPSEKDFVNIISDGYFMDGEQFDNSLTTKQPKQFMMTQVFPGLREVLEMMNKGSRYRVLIPYDQAFGEEGINPQFPPYATLVMDVVLQSIDKLPSSAGGMEMPDGVKIKDVRQKRVSGPPQR